MPPEQPEQAQWFAEHLQVHESLLRAWLRSRFPAQCDVDNIVQEAFVRVWQLHEKMEIASPKALLFVTARNLALDFLRRQRIVSFEPITEIDDVSVLRDTVDVAETVSKRQEFALLKQAIQDLPERCRQVFTLRTVYGLSQKMIAERLGISENTVEKQMSKGLRRCTEFFARHGLP